MKHILKFLLFFLVTSAIFAQNVPPVLVAEIEKKIQYLSLTRVELDVKIFGCLAETKMTMTFYNPHHRELAGDLYFPLPEGATISGYALDIKGVMVDGVVVEKQKGRVVFEKIVRRGIDPGLVEWVKGNNFKTRVFPIPANGSRRLMAKYISELIYRDNSPFYYLPLNFKEKINEFAIRVEVIKAVSKPKIKQGKLANFNFKKWRESFVAETKLKDAKLTEDLIIALPDIDKKRVMVEKSPDGDYYFCINDLSPLSEQKKKNTLSKSLKHITILWDISGSRGKTDHEKEIRILRNYFQRFHKKKISLDLIFFRNKKTKPQYFEITGGNIESIINKIKNVDYDGGTQLGSISPGRSERVPDFYLLFADGLSNFGKEEPEGFKAPVYIFSEDSSANHSFLWYLALKTGGEYFNLNLLDDKIILKRIGISPYSFISAAINNKEVLSLYPRTPQPVQNRFTIVGKLLSKKARIILNYGTKGKTLKKAEFTVSKADAGEGNLLRTFWAQKKIQELMVFPKRNYKELVETGRHYGLVTPGTSLIVLDNVDQYVEHRIVPPESRPEWREEYYERIEQLDSNKKKEEQDHIEYILRLWKERIEWWARDFSQKPAKPKMVKKVTEPRTQPTTEEVTANLALSSLLERVPQAIAGIVKDEEGSVIPGVSITLINTNSDRSQTTVTNVNGIYFFTVISSGVYELKAEMPGYQSVKIKNIRFSSGDKLTYSIILKMTAIEEEITVAGIERAPSPPDLLPAAPTIAIKPWNPQTPYLKALKKASQENVFPVYMKQKEEYGDSPAFFLDSADFFFKQNQPELGLQILSNIAELEMENAILLRILAHRLAQLGKLKLSTLAFEEVLNLRPEEPQSWRDLALVLARQGKYRRAIELLNHVDLQRLEDLYLGTLQMGMALKNMS